MSLKIIEGRIGNTGANYLAAEIIDAIDEYKVPININQQQHMVLGFGASINTFLSHLSEEEIANLADLGIHKEPDSKEIDTDDLRSSLLNNGIPTERKIFLFDDLVRLRLRKLKYDYFCSRELIGSIGMTLAEINYPESNEYINRFKIAHLLGHFLGAVTDVSDHRDREEDDLGDKLIASNNESEVYEGHTMQRHCSRDCVMNRQLAAILSSSKKDIDSLGADMVFCQDCVHSMNKVLK